MARSGRLGAAPATGVATILLHAKASGWRADGRTEQAAEYLLAAGYRLAKARGTPGMVARGERLRRD